MIDSLTVNSRSKVELRHKTQSWFGRWSDELSNSCVTNHVLHTYSTEELVIQASSLLHMHVRKSEIKQGIHCHCTLSHNASLY